MIITLSAEAMRSRIQALIALKASLAEGGTPVLTPNRNYALNQQLALHFLSGLAQVAPAVERFDVLPDDYYAEDDAELILRAEISGAGVNGPLVRMLLENYVSDMTLATLTADTAPAEAALHRQLAAAALESLRSALDDGEVGSLRIARTI